MASILEIYASVNRLAQILGEYAEDRYYGSKLTLKSVTEDGFPELAQIDLEKSYAEYAHEWMNTPVVKLNGLLQADFIAAKLMDEIEGTN